MRVVQWAPLDSNQRPPACRPPAKSRSPRLVVSVTSSPACRAHGPPRMLRGEPSDLDRYFEIVESPEIQAAMAEDGVKAETVQTMSWRRS